MAATDLIRFHLPPDLKEGIQLAARQERRTMSDLLRIIAEDWLTEHNYRQPDRGT